MTRKRSSKKPSPSADPPAQPVRVQLATPTESPHEDSEVNRCGKRGRVTDTSNSANSIDSSTCRPPPSKKMPRSSSPTTREEESIYILKDVDKWMHVARKLKKNDVSFKATTNRDDNIAISPTCAEDSTLIHKILEEENANYEIGTTKRPFLVVIRGLPQRLPLEVIRTDLIEQEFPIINIRRMTTKDQKPMRLLIVQVPDNTKGRSILQIRTCCHLGVKAEEKHRTPTQPQCFKCQKYGHHASSCRDPPRCCKCAEEHLTTDCRVPRTTAAKCINCQRNNLPADHAASARNCPLRPKVTTRDTEPSVKKPTNQSLLAPPTSTAHPGPKRTSTPIEEESVISGITEEEKVTLQYPKPYIEETQPVIKHLLDWIKTLANAQTKEEINVSAFKVRFTKLTEFLHSPVPLPSTPDRLPPSYARKTKKQQDTSESSYTSRENPAPAPGQGSYGRITEDNVHLHPEIREEFDNREPGTTMYYFPISNS